MLDYFFKSLRLIGWLVLTLIASLLFILYTQPGLSFALYMAKIYCPELTYQSANGALMGGFSIEKLSYQKLDTQISINHLSLQWQPADLLHRQVTIQQLNIQDFQISDTQIKKIQLSGNIILTPSLPLSFDIHWCLSPTSNGDTHIFGNFGDKAHYQIHAVNHDAAYPLIADIHATLADINGTILLGTTKNPLGKFTLEGTHSPRYDINWALSLKIPPNPPLKRGGIFLDTLIIKGNVNGLETDLNLHSTIEATGLQSKPVYINKILAHLNVHHFFTQKLSADVDFQIKPGDLLYEKNKKKNAIPFTKLDTHMLWENNRLKTNILWIFDQAKRFEAACVINPINWETFDPKHLERQRLSGHLLFSINSLDFLNSPSLPIKQLKGTFISKINLSGNVAKPSWEGNADLKAQGFLPDLGITLNPINLVLKSSPKEMNLNGKIVSGTHALSITGSSKNFMDNFEAKITGDHFPLMNTKEYQINITPNLTTQWKEGNIVIGGTIDIPSAKIMPLEFTQSVELPPDVIFVSDEDDDNAPSLIKTNSEILVRLGNDVQIDTHGIKGKLVGSVTLTDKSNMPTTGEGEIRIINGTYDAYGQQLTISKGEADFTGGPVDNPQLSIRADRTFNTSGSLSPISNSSIPTLPDTADESSMTDFNKITVGIEITGNVDNPVVRLFSNPATLSQADILSFLVLGRPMSQSSSADGALLMRALSALNVDGTQQTQVIQQLQQTFGLDVLDVETSSEYNASQNAMANNTSLVIGKKLSPRLFVEYSIGIIQNTNLLKVKYLLTPRWMIQTTTDGNNEGADIIYRITKD